MTHSLFSPHGLHPVQGPWIPVVVERGGGSACSGPSLVPLSHGLLPAVSSVSCLLSEGGLLSSTLKRDSPTDWLKTNLSVNVRATNHTVVRGPRLQLPSPS